MDTRYLYGSETALSPRFRASSSVHSWPSRVTQNARLPLSVPLQLKSLPFVPPFHTSLSINPVYVPATTTPAKEGASGFCNDVRL